MSWVVVGLDTRILSFPKFWGSFVFRNYKSVSKQVSRDRPLFIYIYIYMYIYVYIIHFRIIYVYCISTYVYI